MRMVCVERALKSSMREEQQAILEANAAANSTGVVSVEEFLVDDLFDFSNEDEEEEHSSEHQFPEQTHTRTHTHTHEEEIKVSPPQNQQNSLHPPQHDDFCSLPHSQLTLPDEDLADLEWLSHFVEDSFSLTYSPSNFTLNPPQTRPHPPFGAPVPAKTRTKRVRTGIRVWSLNSDTSSTSSSSSTSSNPTKKQRKINIKEFLGDIPASSPARRCTHCLVQKTPQWRTGPLGAKTLCNACGVRFKSGRLLPEYRPACSPTFSSDTHSNNHRKVMEMRRKKETDPESNGAGV